MTDARTLVVLAKRPEPGRVKTRLTPEVSPAAAAELAAAALRDTLDVVSAAAATARILSFDGVATDWLPSGWLHHVQPAGGLDLRIAAALSVITSPALLVGMDTPQLEPGLVDGFDPLRFDACLGPSTDGGYWAIGFRDPANAAAAVLGVPMSTSDTYAAQLRRLRQLGLRVQRLAELTDVDTFPDATAIAARAPHTAFARALRNIEAVDAA